MINLSIIIPTYNSEKYIINTLKTLYNNIIEKYEIIIIDDSNDNTIDKIKEFKKKTDMNIFIYKGKNNGIGSARNIGINKSHGRYLLFLDSDDEIKKNYYYTIKKYLNNIKYDIIFYGYDIKNNNNIIKYKIQYDYPYDGINGPDILIEWLNENISIWTSNIIIKKKIIDNLRYLENISYGEDQNFNMKLLEKAKKIKVIKKSIIYYNNRSDSITKKVNIHQNDYLKSIFDVKYYYKNKNIKSTIIELLNIKKLPCIIINLIKYNYYYNVLSYKDIKKKYINNYKYYLINYKPNKVILNLEKYLILYLSLPYLFIMKFYNIKIKKFRWKII